MRISVVIPAYNEEKYIGKCLDSIIGQEEKVDEIIVVNNNCADNTVEIVKKYKNVKIVIEKKQGMTPARNAGFNEAKNEIIIKCDSDTLLPKNFIREVKINLDNNSKYLGFSFPILLNDFPIGNRSTIIFHFYMLIPRLLIGVYPYIGPCYLIKKSAWDKVKNELCLDDKEVHEDIDLTLHILKFGKIYHSKNSAVYSSARRMVKNPLSFFGEYIVRFFRTLWTHRH